MPGSWEAPSLGRPIITLPPFLIQKLKELAIRAEKMASVSRWLGFPPYNNEWKKIETISAHREISSHVSEKNSSYTSCKQNLTSTWYGDKGRVSWLRRRLWPHRLGRLHSPVVVVLSEEGVK